MNGCWGEVGWSQGAINAGSKMVKAEANKKRVLCGGGGGPMMILVLNVLKKHEPS